MRSGRRWVSSISASADVERLLRVAGEVERLGEVDRRSRAVGGRVGLVRARVRLAHGRDPSVGVAEPGAQEAQRHEHAHLGPLGAGGARLRERRLGGGERLVEVAEQHLHARALLEHVGALGARLRAGAARRRASKAAKLSLPLPAWRRKCPSRWWSSAARSGRRLRVERLERLAQEGDGARSLAGRARGDRREPQQLGPVLARARLGVEDAVPQLERALELPQRDLVGVDALGLHPRLHARAERAPELVRALPVAGELGGHVGVGDVARAARAGPRSPWRSPRAAPCPRPAAGRRGSPRRRARGGTRRARGRRSRAPGGRRPRARPP